MSNFSCNGRITGYMISLELIGNPINYPIIQVWHPENSLSYNVIDQHEVVADDVTNINNGEYYLANISLTGVNRIEFMSGDTYGYFMPSLTDCYSVGHIVTMGFMSYIAASSIPLNNFSIANEVAVSMENMQPLIQIIYGKLI